MNGFNKRTVFCQQTRNKLKLFSIIIFTLKTTKFSIESLPQKNGNQIQQKVLSSRNFFFLLWIHGELNTFQMLF